MNANKFLKNHEGALNGKTVAITGCTGGIGKELCRYILVLGGNLLMVDRNPQKALSLKKELSVQFPNSKIKRITADMQNTASVLAATEEIKAEKPDILIHNAGAYKIPREISTCGYDNVFTINFISPYILTRQLISTVDRIVVVGSIAHNYSKTDENDIDFRKRTASSLVYGNAKRYLMYSHFELCKKHPEIHLAVTHPGITLTGITEHYPKWLYIIIKPLMKIVFMKPKIAALSILAGVFEGTEPYSWLGPKVFGIWGAPKKVKLKTASAEEIKKISENAEKTAEFVEKIKKTYKYTKFFLKYPF